MSPLILLIIRKRTSGQTGNVPRIQSVVRPKSGTPDPNRTVVRSS